MTRSTTHAPVPYHFQDQPELYTHPFSKDSLESIRNCVYGENWPVVYVLSNGKQAYVGETNHLIQRMESHLENPERRIFNTIHVIYDHQYNKSVALDLEASLISMMQVDQRLTLQNQNAGQSLVHDYYMRACYRNESFPKVWKLLQDHDLAKLPYSHIRNSDLYKFSPYRELNYEQFTTAQEILMSLTCGLRSGKEKTFLVRGEAGTGKTLLGVYLLNRLTKLFLPSPFGARESGSAAWILHSSDAGDQTGADLDPANSVQFARYLDSLLSGQFNAQTNPELVNSYLKQSAPEGLNIGFVIPQPALRKTLQNVVRQIPGLSTDLIIGPQDVLKKEYDLLIVDEAHRLRKRSNMPKYTDFDQACRQLGLDPGTASELDWLLKRSKYQILFYDTGQSVKGASIPKEVFARMRRQEHTETFKLNSQMRCMGGQDYIHFVDAFFSPDGQPEVKDFQHSYDLRFYDSFADMRAALLEQEQIHGLCRMTAGFGWPWSTKKQKSNQLYDPSTNKPTASDFMIDDIPLVWNSASGDWVNSSHALDEVGSVDKVQGYDLNYAAVILGPELTYNSRTSRIEVIDKNFSDRKSKEKKSHEEITKIVFNIYRVLMTRGIQGTFVYVTDPELRKWMRQFFTDCR